MLRYITFTSLLLAGMGIATAQHPTQPSPESAPDQGAPTIFPHPDTHRWLLGGQANIIFQAHGPFHSPYESSNSLVGRGEYKTSLIGTLYSGFQLHKNLRYATDAILDVESAGGRGISQALGLAGFTNLDVVRNPTLGSKPYLSRYEIHQVIGLTSKMQESSRTAFSLSTSLPERRVEAWIGRMSLPDLLDLNTIGTDSHLQFLNWSIDNNGAWDYAANTRGYTDALVLEYTDRSFTGRYALAAMPFIANGISLDYAFHRASGQNVELELRHGPAFFLPATAKRKGAVRILGFVNHGNMGVYRTQNQAYLRGLTAKPEITAHAPATTVKYGAGFNFEQELTQNARIYGQVGWNEGAHESFAYTEIDQTIAAGGDYAMRGFNRPFDKVGVTFVTNAIKKDHQAYLALGGLGFLLGDGRLNYAREDLVEGYYNLHAWKGVYYALDEQYIVHPAYNKDRGPVMVESVRMHVDF